MILFILLNRVIDLGSEVVMACYLGVPSKYREVFTLLRKGGLIDPDLEGELARLVMYRNLLSHEYHGIQNSDIMNLIAKMEWIREFVARMRNVIAGEQDRTE